MRMAGRLSRYLLYLVLGFLLFPVLPRATSAPRMAPFPRVTRSPYLQTATPNSIVVRWRTAQPTSSVVRYGPAPGALYHSARSPGRNLDHVVRLSGLSPGQRYYYSVGSEREVFQGGPLHVFTTPPPPDSTTPIRVWVLGDPGTDYPSQKAARDAFLNLDRDPPADLLLTLGDNAYSRGSDRQFQKGFFDVYRDILKGTPLWPALGNHDARSADSATESGVYYRIFTLPRMGQAGGIASGTQAYYSFDYGNAHFLCLNSHDSDLSTNGTMRPWLEKDLAANRKTWTIAYWHHPPYSKGSHDSDTDQKEDLRMTAMREQILPSLEAGGVDLVLCGHSHVYERSGLLRGHYGKSDTFHPGLLVEGGNGRMQGSGAYTVSRSAPQPRGTVYVNAGSAGHATRRRKLFGLNHPAMKVSLNLPGTLVLDIGGNQLTAFFLDAKGVRQDEFTMIKTP